MNKIRLQVAAAALVALAAGAAQAQVSVGASININVPGVYGRGDIGAPSPNVAFVAPPVVYAQPMIIAPSPVAVGLCCSGKPARNWPPKASPRSGRR